MNYFYYHQQNLRVDAINLSELAEQFGTPCYVYSKKMLMDNWQQFHVAFSAHPHRICYAVKANSNIAILHLFATLGSGFDIVSGGELERVLYAGGRPEKVVFSGVGKTAAEMRRALDIGIHCFNIESAEELAHLQAIAQQQQKIAPIALRINPDIDAQTHPYISTGLSDNKFGIEYRDVPELMKKIQQFSHLKLIGLGSHIGSQLTTLSPFLDTLNRLLDFAELAQQHGMQLQHLNLGGGLGVRYHDELPPSFQEYAQQLCQRLAGSPLEIILEPGRALVANTGVLLTRVEYIKKTAQKNFAIVDAAMNDLLRPALYAAWHPIMPVLLRDKVLEKTYDIVGPVCESADFLGKQRTLAIESGDLLAIGSVGAYGFSMSSNYNSRPRAAEVMVADDQTYLIRARETIPDLFLHEKRMI